MRVQGVSFNLYGGGLLPPVFLCRDRRPRLSDCGFKKKQVIFINRIIPFVSHQCPLIVGRGLAPAVILFGQSGTPVPTVRKQAFIFSLTKKR